MTDGNGGTHVVSQSVYIQQPPITVTYPNGFEDLYRHFETPSSTTYKSYVWDFGDGVVRTDDNNTTSHTYTTSGYYKVTLTLTLIDETTIQSQVGIFVGPGTRIIQGHTIYGDEAWYSGGTYVVQGNVQVAQGAKLTIEPGVVVKFADQQGITVNGILDARGTDDKKIVFTSVWDDTYGGNTDPSGGDHIAPGESWRICPECSGDSFAYWAATYWGQITFGPTSVNSVIDRAVILYGGSLRYWSWPGNPYGTGMVSIQSSSVAVTNSTISHSLGNGIDVSASPVITGDTISGNRGQGIYLSGTGSSPVITGGTIRDNGANGIYNNASGPSSSVISGELITGNVGWGIACSVSPTPLITGNTVSNNGAGGISCSPSVLSGNTITGNNGPAIQQDASGAWADGTNTISGNTYNGVAITGGTLSRNTTFTANIAKYLIGNTVTVPEGVNLTIEPGVVVKFADQQGITVNGTLDARGTDDKKIVFTSVWDDTYGGNTDPSGGDHTAPGESWRICPECSGDSFAYWAATYWGQMVFGPTSVNSVIDRAVILYGGSLRYWSWPGNPYGTGMVSIQSSSVAVTNSTISHSLGNGIDVSASPVITGDTISKNGGYGLYYTGPTTLLATNNNWGDPSGPLDDSDDRAIGGWYNPNGKGNRVSDHVNYSPWTGMTVSSTATPTGLDAKPGNGAVNLKWTPSVEPGLGGYKVYYGMVSGSYGTPLIIGTVSSYKLNGLTNGTPYYIAISSLNSIGAESAKSTEVTATPIYDVTAPIVTVAAPAGNAVLEGKTCTVMGNANDGVGTGIKSVEVSTDSGANWQPVIGISSWSYTWQLPANGTYRLSVRASDNADNVSTPLTLQVTVANKGPDISFSTLADGAVTNNPALNVAGTVTDPSGVKGLTINGQAVTIGTDNTFSFAILLVTGANTITTIATNTTGNQTTDIRMITLDQKAPALTITAPADNSKINKTFVDVTGSVDEKSTVDLKVNNGSTQTATMNGTSFISTINLASGINTIDIAATDQAGNTANAKRTVTSDTGAPSLAVTDPAQDITTNLAGVTIQGTVSDALTAITITITADGQTYTPQVTNGSFTQTITLTSAKTYAVIITATDEAGNQTIVQRNLIYVKSSNGDISGDGKVDIADALMALKIAVGIIQMDNKYLADGDVAPYVGGKPKPDGKIDISDALLILKKCVGLVTW